MPANAASQLTSPDIEEVALSVEDEPAAPVTEPLVAPQPYENRARRRRAKTHQPLRVAPPLILMGFVLLVQVVALLWLQGMAMSARNRVSRLDRAIATSRLETERTRDAIAARLADESQIGAWATEGGWLLAEQSQIDDVRDHRIYVRPTSEPQRR